MVRIFLTLFFVVVLFQGCASSDLSRNAASQVDDAYQNSNASLSRMGTGSVASSFQNSSQTSKGVLIGGTTGAIAGTLTSGVGALPGAIEGAIFGGALGAYIDAHTTLADKLKNRNVKVIVLGDQVLIVLPSRVVFNAMTPDINPDAYSTLNLVAELLNGYPNMSVKVAAYTNKTGPEQVNLALSKEQAKSVMKYLWRQGVNTRLLYAEGYGGSRLVEKNSMDWDYGQNYRIEITLEKLPV